jgi:hypothetical protein
VQAASQTLITLERSQVVSALLPVGRYGYDRGVFGYYLPTKGLTFATGVVNGEDLDVAADSNHGKNFVGRLAYRQQGKIDTGISFYTGTLAQRSASGAYLGNGVIDDVNRYGFDFLYTAGPYAVISEYLRGKNGSVDANGWYITGAYQKVGSRYQTYARYQQYDPNTDVGINNFKSWTVGESIYFAKFTKLTFEYESIDDKIAPTFDGKFTTQLQVTF